MASYYNGNLTNLRQRRNKIISKREELRKEYNYNIPVKEQIALNKKITELSNEVDKIEREIKKIQKGMQNSNHWMDGTVNNAIEL